MARTNPETALTRKIVSHLEAFGFWCVKLHGSQYQMAGLPDIMAFRAGVTVFLEVKTPTGKTSRVQDCVHAKMRRYGIPVEVVRSPEHALEFASEHCPTTAAYKKEQG